MTTRTIRKVRPNHWVVCEDGKQVASGSTFREAAEAAEKAKDTR